MRRTWFLWLCIDALVVFSIAAQTVSDPNLVVTTVTAPGISQPTGLRFLDNDSIFVIEKATGDVKLVENGATKVVLDLTVDGSSERGLLGIELHPNFSTNGHTYLYYSAVSGGTWSENRLSRFTWDSNTEMTDQVS